MTTVLDSAPVSGPPASSPLPYTFPSLEPSPIDLWRSISLDEDRHSGRTPLACFYHLLHLHRSPALHLKHSGPAPFTLPHTLLYSQQSIPHVSPHPFLTLLEWYHSVPTPSSYPRVVRATRPSLTDTPARILQALTAIPSFSSTPSHNSRTSHPSSHPSRQTSGPRSGRGSYQSTYARPSPEWKTAEPIIAQLLTLHPSSPPTLLHLTPSTLRSFLAPPPSPPTADAEADARQALYRNLFSRHPHLTFDSDSAHSSQPPAPSPPTHILQAFAYPTSPHPHAQVLRVQWKAATASSPPLCVTQRYTCPHPLHDYKLPPQQRGDAYAYPPAPSPSPTLVLRGPTADAVSALCLTLASHIHRGAEGLLNVSLMTVYLRPAGREGDPLHVLWCDKLVFAHELEGPSPTPSSPPTPLEDDDCIDPRLSSVAVPHTADPTPLPAELAMAPPAPAVAPSPLTVASPSAQGLAAGALSLTPLASPDALLPFITAIPLTTPIYEEEEEAPPLGVDIDHIGPPDGWADQVWQVIRARRAKERQDISAFIRAHERGAGPLSPTPPARPEGARGRRRSSGRASASQPGTPASAPTSSLGKAAQASRWEDRGLVHHWRGKGTQAQTEAERREIWQGQLRGKRAQLEALTRAAPAAAPAPPPVVGVKVAVEEGGWRVEAAVGGEGRPRALPWLIEEGAEGCVRCGLGMGAGAVTVRLATLLGEEARVRGLVGQWRQREREQRERLRRARRVQRQHWRGDVEGEEKTGEEEEAVEVDAGEAGDEELWGGEGAMPRCVRRVFPRMEDGEWRWYRGREELGAVEVEVCQDCGEWCGRPSGEQGDRREEEESKEQMEEEDGGDEGERRAALLAALVDDAVYPVGTSPAE